MPPEKRRSIGLLIAIVLLVIALAATGTVAVVQSRRLASSRDTMAELRDQSEDDAARIADLQQALEERPEEPANPLDSLEDLLGEGGLGELFGQGGNQEQGGEPEPEEDAPEPEEGAPDQGQGGLEDLFGEGGLEDLLGQGGLGELFGEGDLEDMLGGIGDAPQVDDCITGIEDLPDVAGNSLQQQFADATEAVEDLRGQDFPEMITPTIKSSEEIRSFFNQEITEEYPADEADLDQRILAGLGAIPADLDLIQTQTELLGDQVAGYYDDETKELVVRADDPNAELGAFGLIALAHELEHALVDATVGLPPLDEYGTDEDAALAALATVEGSAVALQTQFQMSAMDPMALLAELGANLDQGLDEVPYYIAQNLTFPYIAGPTYVCGLYGQGGWDAVNQAVGQPPSTSHQILFPGQTEDAVDVPDPSGPEGYERHETRTFGAAPLSWLFGAPAGDESLALPDPTAAVAPWRGGEVTLWTSGDDSAIAMVLAGEGLCDPVGQWWSATAGGPAGTPEGTEQVVQQTAADTWGVVLCDGEDVRLGVGPTVEIARAATR